VPRFIVYEHPLNIVVRYFTRVANYSAGISNRRVETRRLQDRGLRPSRINICKVHARRSQQHCYCKNIFSRYMFSRVASANICVITSWFIPLSSEKCRELMKTCNAFADQPSKKTNEILRPRAFINRAKSYDSHRFRVSTITLVSSGKTKSFTAICDQHRIKSDTVRGRSADPFVKVSGRSERPRNAFHGRARRFSSHANDTANLKETWYPRENRIPRFPRPIYQRLSSALAMQFSRDGRGCCFANEIKFAVNANRCIFRRRVVSRKRKLLCTSDR